MSQHMKPTAASPQGPSPKRALIAGALVVALGAGGAGTWALSHADTSNPPAEKTPEDEGDDATTTVVEPAGKDDDATPASLPFSLEGVSANAAVTEVSEGVGTASLAGEWTFGGDYAQIGSYPVDATTVFGSATSTPDDMTSYTAALIRSDGSAEQLEEPQTGASTIYEPQDGTATASSAVWRSSVLSLVPSTGIDDWRVQAWFSEGGVLTLGTARALNNSTETPLLDGDLVPTQNDEQAFFATNYWDGSTWVPSVLAFDLGTENSATVVDTGSYPAATEQGAVYAASQLDSAQLYGTLRSWSDGSSSDVFSVSSKSGTWGISGIWAAGNHRVVAFSSADGSDGCYLGIWDASFEKCLAWLHVASTRVVASLNSDWLVWGSGSQAENVGMYAYRFADGKVSYLGAAAGYSRPAIAADNNSVLVPESDGRSAVTFHVGVLE